MIQPSCFLQIDSATYRLTMSHQYSIPARWVGLKMGDVLCLPCFVVTDGFYLLPRDATTWLLRSQEIVIFPMIHILIIIMLVSIV